MSSKISNTVTKGYSLLTQAGDLLQSPFLLAVRLYWGWQFIQTGLGKLHRLQGVTEFFTSLNIPFPHFNAVFVSWLELVGGILLIAGLGTRLLGLMLATDMFVAYLTADREALRSIFSSPDKFYAASPYTFLVASLILFIFGAGLFSIDALIARLRHKEKASDLLPREHRRAA